MATQETQQLDSIISSRRAMLAMGGAALATLAFAPKAEAQAAVTDNDILNFALNLEYLEAQFYTLAASGVTIDKLMTPIPVAVNGGTAGAVTLKPSFAKVPFANTGIAAYAAEVALEEQRHVKFLQSALGTAAVSMPAIDLYTSFNTLASVAGIGAAFDPFASDGNFLVGSYIFEDVGVSAYHGAAGLITDKTKILPAAVGIHAVEAYHAGLIRTTIAGIDAQNGNTALSSLTQKISAARAKLANPSGTPIDDVGVTTVSVALNGSSNNYMAATLVNADTNSIGWSRTTTQVLAIVTGGGTGNKGVFYPAGLNGTIK
jgi:hypothetical protein